MNNHLQNTEYELLQYFIGDNFRSRAGGYKDFLSTVTIDEKIFTEPCRRIFNLMLKLKNENRPITELSLVNEGVGIDQIISMSSTNTKPTFISDVPDVLEAYKLLSKAALWKEGESLRKDFTDPQEYYAALSEIEIKSFLVDSSFEQAVKNYLIFKDSKNENQIITNWTGFNAQVAFEKGELVVLGARTSIGKTTFALNVAVNAAALGQKVLFVSMEMSKNQIFDKIGAILTNEPVWKYKKGTFNRVNFTQELKAIEENFHLEHLPKCTSTDIDRLVKHFKPDLVVVDYLQLMKDSSKKSETEANRLGRISGNLKAIASLSNVLLLVPAQLNREGEKQGREPIVSDLRDSGCIEQDADIVLLLHRESRDAISAKLTIAKHRTGQTGFLGFDFFTDTGRFMEFN